MAADAFISSFETNLEFFKIKFKNSKKCTIANFYLFTLLELKVLSFDLQPS
jgi:hypothetical protein